MSFDIFMKLTVAHNKVNERLDKFLQAQLTDLSRSKIQQIIKAGRVAVNSRPAKSNYKLKINDVIDCAPPEKAIEAAGGMGPTNTLWKIKIIFESSDYVVINKPAGLVIHPAVKHQSATLVDWLLEKYPAIQGVGNTQDVNFRPGIVHRLDKDVSGVMVVARSPEGYEHLKRQFQERQVEKEYLALVHGRILPEQGEVRLGIGRGKDRKLAAHTQANLSDKNALTRYEVLKRLINYTLLKINIVTGRTHQIRVHMGAIGHSVVGDKLYATRDIRKKKKKEELGRLWLVAKKLAFNDLAGVRQEYAVEIPADLNGYLSKLK